uniref:Calcium uptake protein 1 homolog, mitochondrial n=1 Tax=Panagrellus redivivus TaxID=6233 RepID=A0A7E4VB65_PANRE
MPLPRSLLLPRLAASRLHHIRCKSELFKVGQGVRSIADIDAQKKHEAATADDPMAYTITGVRRGPESNPFHYTDRKAGRGYSDYSTEVYENRPYIWQPLRRYFKLNWFIMFGLLFGCMVAKPSDWKNWANDNGFLPKAAVRDGSKDSEKSETDSDGEHFDEECSILPEDVVKKKKRKIGFRERRIIEYENRLRTYSSPDKIFRYFATLKVIHPDASYDVYMNPEDFVRSLTPGVMQPRSLGLDKFKVFIPDKHKSNFTDPDCIFHKLGENGLINFTDYLFLMTLLSTPPNEFRLAFSIFDINGDGHLDKEEFSKVQKLLLSQSTVGQKHRDHNLGSSSFRINSESALNKYFFGANGEKKLDIATFLQFQHDLHRDILKIEFERRDPETMPVGIISEISFAELLMMHSGLTEKRQKRMVKRVKKKYKPIPDKKGISFDEVNDFFQFLYHIDDVDTALHFYKLAGKALTKELLVKVARKISNVELTDNLVDVVIALFDDNHDGQLSHREFVSIMKKRMQRGLEKPKDTGLIRLIDAAWECARRQTQQFLLLPGDH